LLALLLAWRRGRRLLLALLAWHRRRCNAPRQAQ
jgi:hypothetical protein